MALAPSIFQGLGGKVFSAGMLALGIAGVLAPFREQAKAAATVSFAEIKPIFSAHCLRCHSADHPAGGLNLETHEAVLKGGASGRAVVVGDSKASLLMQRLLGQGGMPQMPMGFTALGTRELNLIRDWIDGGCAATSASTKRHWAYVKPVRPAIPTVRRAKWVHNAIDAFVLKRLEAEDLTPSPPTDPTTLIRRVTLDLTGLPPSPAEVNAFLADKSPGAYERVVDRLFASPHYGERMVLPWLDAARYADSNGFQMDGDTDQYVWRDWVVKALNQNMPFDRFTVLQLAGDLLPGVSQSTPEGRDALVATAFNRNHMLNGEGGAIPEEARNVAMFDRVDTTATTWLGLTMTCTRCHDHKYDPLTQRDYFGMMAYFNNVPETGIPEGGVPYSVAAPWIYAGSPDEMTRLTLLKRQVQASDAALKSAMDDPRMLASQIRWEESLRHQPDSTMPKDVAMILDLPASQRTAMQAAKLTGYFIDATQPEPATTLRQRSADLQKELSQLQATLPRVMVMSDAKPRETHIYSRGNYDQPLAAVSCDTPAVLNRMAAGEPPNRLGLARWIVSRDNPLTARVQVNRYWQLFFGRGLVKTPENFGVQGEPPSHPELLDWLAVEFEESGWNVKRLQRLIVLSATYRQSSKVSPAMVHRDPENRLLARGARFRLPAMLLRDEALAASGLLNPSIGGKPVYPYQPKGIWDGLAITDERDFHYPQSTGSDLYRRSLYSFWRRTVAPGNMFDAASRQICTIRQSQTSTPLHALTTLNDVTWVEAGRALAERVMTSAVTPQARITEAFRRVCARRPDTAEIKILLRSLERAKAAFQADPKAAAEFLRQGDSPRNAKLDAVEHAAYASVCLAILNLDEALTRE